MDRVAPIRVMVVYGLGIAGSGTCLLIDSDPRFAVVAEATDALEAGRKAAGNHPDVVVIGPNRSFGPELHTQLEIIGTVRAAAPNCKALLMSLNGDDVSAITEGVAAGADGSIALGSTAEAFLGAIAAAAGGHGEISGDVVKKIIARAAGKDPSALGERDLEILCGVAFGYTSTEIAGHLNLSARTIEGRRLEINGELDISSRSQLVAWALAHELFEAPVGYYAGIKQA